jgi:hypothetical protein
MLLRKNFIDLHFGRVVVTDSLSQTIVVAQIEHSIAGRNLDGHAK